MNITLSLIKFTTNFMINNKHYNILYSEFHYIFTINFTMYFTVDFTK